MRRAGALWLLAAAMGLPSARADEPKPPDLPRLGTIGRRPDPSVVIPVAIDRDGRITVDGGRSLGLAELRDELRRRTDKSEWRNDDGTSNRVLLVDADAAVPWRLGQWVVQVAADPRIQISRIFFGARPLEGEGRGAIGWTLPVDRGLSRSGTFPDPIRHVAIKAFAAADADRSDPQGVAASVRRALADGKDGEPAIFEVKAPPPLGAGVPTGTVMAILDVLHRAGARDVRFEGAAPPQDASANAIRAWVKETRATKAIPYLVMDGKVVPPAVEDAALAKPGGLRDALVGFGRLAGNPPHVAVEAPDK
jgi:biopolymer transport protein ExbD